MLIKIQFRFPEIVIGILLSVAIFAMGMVFESSRNHPSQQSANRQSAQIEETYKAIPFSWHWFTRDGTVFFTSVLSLVAAIQAALFLWQLSYMKQGMKDAKVAADAARKSADASDLNARAVVALKLPIIRITPDNLGHGLNQFGDVEQFEECAVAGIKISNLGETRAFPIEILYGWTIGHDLPEEPSYRYSDRFKINTIIEPDPKITPYKRLTMANPLNEGDWSKISKGNYCWFYCSLRYNDFMDELRTHGFCWQWGSKGGGLEWVEDRTPAYNRKT